MTDPADRNAAARRLLNALAAEPNSGDHAAIQDLLPEFAEAEMAGDDAAGLFPEVQAHLDICETCGQLYAELLDVMLADEAAEIAPVAEPRPANLPPRLVVRRRVRDVAASVLAALGLGLRELEPALEYVFSGLVPGSTSQRGHMIAERASSVYGMREAAAVATAAYNAMMLLTAASAHSLLAEQSSGGMPALVSRVAQQEAARVHLDAKAEDVFVRVAVMAFGQNYGELVDLAGQPDHTD